MTSAGSPSQSVDADVPVLVVGGSIVGLASAMFLAQHGVETLSVEKHDGTAIHPRAGYFQLRTIELMRIAGIEDQGAGRGPGALRPRRRAQRRRDAGRS